jgi:pimeloyl-ACP methyl ester carboxylesterase
MNHVISKDGTRIAFDRIGSGQAIILVDGALCHRRLGPSQKLAELLANNFTVFTYDRRGRGESGDTQPYTVEREVEDLESLIKEAGGTVYIFGVSSGAALSLEAAKRIPGIAKLALFEAPFIVDGSRPTISWEPIRESIAADHRGKAIKLFLKAVGAPAIFIAFISLTPMWHKLKEVANTLPYDGTIVEDKQKGKHLSADWWDSVTMPTLAMDGGKSPKWIRQAMQELANILPNAQYRTLKGQTHNVTPKVHAPVLAEFFGAKM